MMKKAGLALLVLAALSSLANPAAPQEKIVTAKISAGVESLMPGGTYALAVEITIAPSYHINAEVPSEDYLIGTAVAFAPKAGVTFGKVAFPQKTVFVNAAGCLTLLATYPFTPFRGSWLYTAMASAPAGAQGVRDALDILLEKGRMGPEEWASKWWS